jgi:phage replication O-like protein O
VTKQSEPRFVPPPGYTQIPNALLDELLPLAGHAEFKVVMAIARRTFGWGIEERLLTNAQLCSLTGLSRQAVTDALKGAEERGYVRKRNAGANSWRYGIPVKKPDSCPSDQNPSNQDVEILATRKPLIGKQTPTESKQRQGPAGAGSVKKPNGDKFGADPNDIVDAAIVAVFDAWHSSTEQPSGSYLTNGRAGQLRARLREAGQNSPDVEREPALAYAREELLEAVKGMATSKWHRNQGQTDFTLLFRNRERVMFFLERLQKTATEEPDAAERFSQYDAQIENRRPR